MYVDNLDISIDVISYIYIYYLSLYSHIDSWHQPPVSGKRLGEKYGPMVPREPPKIHMLKFESNTAPREMFFKGRFGLEIQL